ncbi:MAG TPA: glycosyltransferase family 4 protein [Methylomirabilota bacterium]|nr:glycosyltransferase family 4 protein [Methylomirabilota bacterium]
MKVLFDHHLPFALTHGGLEQQLVETKAALEKIGFEADYVRWWDAAQCGDIIHFIGRPTADYISFAHGRGCKVIIAELLTATGSRSSAQLSIQKKIISVSKKILPSTFTSKLAWDSYRLADACIALTSWEAHLMNYLFDAPKERVHVVPNGVEEIFLNSQKAARGKWLVCTATITERKRVLELAQAAVRAQTPLWVIGKAYVDSDSHAQKFFTLAKQEPQIIRYEGAVFDRARLARIYREARGFVLLSAMESLSLSALEAAAGECPLLLSDLPWARGTFGAHANYCPVALPERTAEFLKKFYDAAPDLLAPPKPATWENVAYQLKTIYERVFSTSR